MSFPVPYIATSTSNPCISNYLKSKPHKSYDTMISNIAPVPYTIEDALRLRRILESCCGNFLVPQVRVTWPNLEERFASNLEKLLISMKAYMDSNNPVIPRDTLIDILCRSDAAKFLKNIRTKSMMRAWGTDFVETPDWWEETPSYVIFDIGDIFYYKYAFFWEEENSDYLEQLQPFSLNENTVALFKESAEKILDELDFDFDFEPEEVLLQPRSSKIINSKFESKNDSDVRFEKYPSFRFGPRQPGKRCVIPVHPGGVRDTIINQLEDLNTVMAIEKIVSRCLKDHPNTVINNTERFKKKLDDFYFKYDFFYCRDIAKEGITKPRYLLKIMLEALFTRCEYLKQVCTKDFFDGDWCEIDGTVIHSIRGHGLGMANSLTTLMQIILYRMAFIRYSEDHYVSGDFVEFFALNDDCVFGLNLSEEEAFEFSQIDHEILEELGIIRKKTKSFLARKGFVFLEIYYPYVFSTKDSLVRRTYLLPYSATNISHAKDLMSLMTENPYLDTILTKWGYEFYPEEVNYPRHLGGWFSKSFYGLDISLDIELKEFSSQMSRAAQAVLFSDIKFKKRLSKNCDPLNLLFYKDIDPYILNKLPVVGSRLFSTFERLKVRSDFNILYDRFYKKRQYIYEKSPYIDFKTYLSILREESDKDIFISSDCDRWIKDFEIDIFSEGSFTDPYRYSFPLCAALRKVKGIKIDGKPTSYWPITHNDSSFLCSVLRSEIAEMNLDYYAFTYTDEDVVLPTGDKDFSDFVNSWRNPVAVGKYCQIRFNRLMIPKTVPEVIKYKKDYFSRSLTRLEFLLLQGMKYSVIEEYLSSSKSLEDFIDEYKESVKDKFKTFDDHDSNHFDDSDPDDFDGATFIKELFSRINLKPLKQQVIEALPEGWDITSFDVDDNIIYTMENQDVFEPVVIEWVNSNYGNVINIWNRYLSCVALLASEELREKMEIRRLEIMDEHPLIKEYVIRLSNKEIPKGSDEDDEIDFAGDFDVF